MAYGTCYFKHWNAIWHLLNVFSHWNTIWHIQHLLTTKVPHRGIMIHIVSIENICNKICHPVTIETQHGIKYKLSVWHVVTILIQTWNLKYTENTLICNEIWHWMSGMHVTWSGYDYYTWRDSVITLTWNWFFP
jgi:hypothetical protein